MAMTFEEFAGTQVRPLLGLMTAMCGDAGLAEDLVQDVLLKAHQRWAKISKLDLPERYVRKMLVNEFVSWRRKWARLVPTAEIDLFDDGPDLATTHADRSALQSRLEQLPRRQQAVLALRYFADLSDTEIAEALGCSVGAVRAYISRGLSTLRTDTELLTTNRFDIESRRSS
jgi:RNA polymerase sigma-70 factor (sigma-E family)